MRVPTKLTSISYILVTTLIVLLSAIIWLLIITRSSNSDLKLVDEIQTNFLERTSLRDQYFLYHEEFIRIQWEKSKQLSDSLLRQAGLQLRDKESLKNIDALVRNIDDTAAIFHRIVANSNALKSAGDNREILEELDKRLSSQLLLKATLIRDTIFVLKKSSLKHVQGHYRQLTVSILLLASTLSIGIILWNILLKQQVKNKTIHLENEMAERKRVEGGLLKSEELYRSLFANMLNGFVYGQMLFENGIPQDYIYLAVNESFSSLTGLKDVVGRKVTEVIPGIREADPQLFEVFGRVATTKKPEQFEIFLETLQMWFLISVYSPECGYFVAVFDVITERKRAEQLLQAKNTELDRFAYTVSHDLKSPLITIQAYAGMIKKELETGKYERAQDDMKRIEGAAGKMTSLLNDLLELSRAGRMMSDSAAVDMNRLVKNTLQQMAGPITGSHVEIVLQPGLPSVNGDEKRIAVVVQNLIENAIKYMGDQATPRIEIGTRQEGKECVFFVSDNGKGIDSRHHEKVFGLFNKLDAESEGTGVGLALVKRIIEVHGGRVWVESEGEGTGSRLCFTVGL